MANEPKKKLDKTLFYSNLRVKLDTVEVAKQAPGMSAPAPEGKEHVIFGLTLRNTRTDVSAIIFFEEEVWLSVGKDLVAVENYKINNNFDPGQESSGYVIFTIPENTKQVSLLFGKKNLQKLGADVSL
jgi:hypothetical protein